MLPAANPHVIFKQMSDGAVLFAPKDELYFGLNEVGARIWHLLPPVTDSFDALCARLSADYPDVPMDTLRRDARDLLDALVSEGLAIASPSTVPNLSSNADRAP